MDDVASVIIVTGGSGFIGGHVIRALMGLTELGRGGGAGVAGEIRERFRIIGSCYQHTERFSRDLRDSDFTELVELPLEDGGECILRLEEAVGKRRVEAVVHCAAMANLAVVERERELAQRVNVEGTIALAEWTKRKGGRFIFMSTDQVFDGEKGWYAESDEVSPINAYGVMKVEAEAGVREVMDAGKGIALRVSLVYGASGGGRRSASEQIHDAFARGDNELRLFTDEYRTPTFVGDIAKVVLRLADEGRRGREWPELVHIAGAERVSRYELGMVIAEKFGFDKGRVVGILRRDLDLGMNRPGDLSLDITLAREVLGFEPVGLDEGLGVS